MSSLYASTTSRHGLRSAAVRATSAVAVACAVSAGSLLALGGTAASAAAPATVAVPDVTPDNARTMPMYAHMPNPTVAEIQKRIDAGWATGAFLYYDAGTTFGWSTQWDLLAAAFPNGIDLFVSPKNFTTASLTEWCEKLSPAQRAKTVFAYWQEPEDNFITDEARADFRQHVVDAAAIVQPFGIRNGLELQSWTLNEGNKNEWGGRENFKSFIPRDKSTVDFVGISLYDYYQNLSGPTQLKPVVSVLNRQLPDAEWGPVATGWTIPSGTPLNDPIRQERADAADNGFNYAERNGATALGWWDFKDWSGLDSDVASDPLLLAMLLTH